MKIKNVILSMQYKAILFVIVQIAPNYCQTPYYKHLRTYITQFKRPLTILDLTYDDNTNLMQELSSKNFDLTYVSFNNKTVKMLDNFIILKKFPSLVDIAILADSEAIDIVLADWNIFKDKIFNDVCPNLIKLGMITFFINTNEHFIENIKSLMAGYHDFKILLTQKGILITKLNQKILRQSAFSYIPILCWNKYYIIDSTFEEKFFYKNQEKIMWIKGINLCTCLSLDIQYPTRKTIINNIYDCFSLSHMDYRPWNIIVQGKTLKSIDNDNRTCKLPERLSNLRHTLYSVYHGANGCYPFPPATFNVDYKKIMLPEKNYS